MTFFDAIKTCYSKYADFDGCASRSEYWWFVLFTLLASFGFALMSDVLSGLFTLANLLPTIAVTARRLHDTDRSGWLQLIGLIPLVGWILVLVWYVQDSKRPNRFSMAADVPA
jgi:uncharacterized membrane protein YhaH (DUF805 family)